MNKIIMCGIQHIEFLGYYYYYLCTPAEGLITSTNFPTLEQCELALEEDLKRVKEEQNLKDAEIDRVDGIEELQG